MRTVLSQTSSWIIREFINLILLGPTDRSASDLAGFDIISRSAESVSVELTRWPEISSSLQKRLDGWQRTLITGNSYPTKDSPQCGHLWENLVSKASVMGQSQTPIVTPAPLRPRGSNSPTKSASYEPVASAAAAAGLAAANYIPDRTSSYGAPGPSNNGGSSKFQTPYDKQVERLQSQAANLRAASNPVQSNNYTPNTSRRIEPSPMTSNPQSNNGGSIGGFSPLIDPQSSQHTITAENQNLGGGVAQPQSGNFDDYVRNQFDQQDRTIADAVSYFQRERQRMLEVKEKLRDLEKQQELLTFNYKRQMEELDRKKREVFDRYQTDKTAPPVNVPAEVVGAMPQSSTVHFDLGEADRHVQASQQASVVPQSQAIGNSNLAGPGGHEYYDDDEWEQQHNPPPQRRNTTKSHKMHAEFGTAGPGAQGGGMAPSSPEQTQQQVQGGKKPSRVSWIHRAIKR